MAAYSFVDERYIPFYSVIIDASIREATYVLDGLLHNDAIKSTIHTTDTHGFTEALFGTMDLLGFGFSPNIAKLYEQTLYTVHVLRFTDDLEMRQDSRKSGNAIESSNRLSSAIFFANGGEMIFLTRPEQQVAEACKRLIKNSIICWNYLYLTRKVQQAKNTKELLEAAKATTANAWRHIYFNGTYDFSDENLADSFNLLHSQNYSLHLA